MIRTTLLICVAIVGAVPASAQKAPPPKRSELAAPVAGTSPAARYLVETYGISEAEARERIELQDQVSALAARIRTGDDPAFGGIWIEHEPVFKVNIGFADQDDRKALRESIAPALRRHVQIRNVPKSNRVADEQLDAIIAALATARIDYTSGFEPRNGKLFVAVATGGEAQTVRLLLPPALRGDVDVRVEPIPRAEAPTGLQPGDEIEAGYEHYQSANFADPGCTFGYSVRYGAGGTPGILTAGHCVNAGFLWQGHWVSLGAPVLDENRYGTKFDYQIFDTSGLVQGPWVWFSNSQRVPEFPSQGYYRVVGQTGYYGQTAGMVMCKSGRVTGITCGQITNGAYVFNGAKGWIEVGNTKQADLSEPGDSGSPWFIYPGTSSDVKAVGIHTAGTGNCTGPTCKAVYMPIDYIDDHIPVTLTVATP